MLLSSPLFVEHINPALHPEQPNRVEIIEEVLKRSQFKDLRRIQAKKGSEEQLLLIHSQSYIEMIRQSIPSIGGLTQLDADTFLSPSSWEVLMYVTGGICQAIDMLISENGRVFCVVRPPGHHAEKNRAMGFCIFNNAALAARWAQQKHKIKKVAIMDFDLHHGNGTQDIFWEDASVMYASTHQMPLFPGTGAKDEVGTANTIVNAPLHPGDGGKEFREAMNNVILPRIDDFAPELLVISAGFDAHKLDHIGELELCEKDFAWATHKLIDIANTHANRRVISILEGGYNLHGLALSVEEHVMALLE